MRLLFVNDESFVLTAYLNQLEMDFDVIIAENGLQAVNIVKQHHRNYFDVIVLDINMPIMDGYEACDRIYEHLCGSESLNDLRILKKLKSEHDFKLNSINEIKPVGNCPVLIFALT